MSSFKNFRTTAISGSVVLLSGTDVSGQNLFEQIGWRGADAQIIIVLVFVFLTGFSILLYSHIRALTKEKKSVDENSFRLFDESVKKAELTSAEINRLKQLLRHTASVHLHTIFQSAQLFETCIDSEIRFLLSQNLTAEQILSEDLILSSLRKKMGYNFLPYEHPLISTRNLEIGQKVTVYGRRNDSPVIQNARVVQNKEFSFRIQFDPEKEEASGSLDGQPFLLAFARYSDGVYGIPVILKSSDYSSNMEFLHSMEIRRNQLREYVRIEVSLQAKLRMVKSLSNESTSFVGKTFDIRISDISGGGGCIIMDRPLVPGDIVTLNFQLSSGAFSGILCKILRVSLQEIHDKTIYKHSLQFINMDQRDRDKIVKYVFEKQRQLNQLR